MGIIKILPYILLAIAVFLVFKKFRKAPSDMARKPSSNKMVACCVCETHIPENEAISHNGKIYCSKEHLE
ncbi:MAG: PP0621 family protein [Gammaproteobacteria bacterium]|nr:PP0621 family protein [Gammaproteobacteria bacterium]